MNKTLSLLGLCTLSALASSAHADASPYRLVTPEGGAPYVARANGDSLTRFYPADAARSLVRFIAHESNPAIACATSTGSDYRFECSWDGGKTWVLLEQAPAGSTTPLSAGRSFNQLASEANGNLLLTAYDRQLRIKPAERTVTTAATLARPDSCPTGAATCAEWLLAGYAPVWFDPAASGQGITLVPVANGTWGYYTAYDNDRSAKWWLFHGSAQPEALLPLSSYTGPYPPGNDVEWDPTLVKSSAAGTLALTLYGPGLIGATVTIEPKPGTRFIRQLDLVPFL